MTIANAVAPDSAPSPPAGDSVGPSEVFVGVARADLTTQSELLMAGIPHGADLASNVVAIIAARMKLQADGGFGNELATGVRRSNLNFWSNQLLIAVSGDDQATQERLAAIAGIANQLSALAKEGLSFSMTEEDCVKKHINIDQSECDALCCEEPEPTCSETSDGIY